MANYNDNRDTQTETKVKAGAAGAGLGIGAIVVIAIIAILAYFFFNGKTDTPATVTNDVSQAAGATYGAAKDVGKEPVQAAKDATTPGDQSTTRPNADGSTKSLDQK